VLGSSGKNIGVCTGKGIWMKKIPVKMLQAGSMYTEPVYIDESNLLVPARIAIRKKDISRLISWGVETVYTEGETTLSTSPQPEAAVKFPAIPSLTESLGNDLTYRVYTSLIGKLSEIFSDIASGNRTNAQAVNAVISRLLGMVREEPENIIGYILGGEVKGHGFAKSSMNAAILSYLITAEFKAPNHKLLQIVTGALLHDVGMLRLPQEILNKQGELTGTELQYMQTHPVVSYRIVCKEFLYPEEVGQVVLQHHERWDGTGYPQGLGGTRIDSGARIVSVVDAFEAMVSKKPYRNSMIGYQAMKNLMADNSRRFDSNVLKAFIKIMGIYPIGSLILLNTGAVARVTEVRKEAPLRPRITIVLDKDGKTYHQNEGEAIDLLNEKTLFITRALDPTDVMSQGE
jgi:HD-GYP domain-containing protein (c-di-GMP phosphodiesterase class II)